MNYENINNAKRWENDAMNDHVHKATMARNAEIIELRSQNIPTTKLAKRFGLSRQRIDQILKKYAPDHIRSIRIYNTGLRTPREKRTCPIDKVIFTVKITSKKIYCSIRCAGKAKIKYHDNPYPMGSKEYNTWRHRKYIEAHPEVKQRMRTNHKLKMKTNSGYAKRYKEYQST